MRQIIPAVVFAGSVAQLAAGQSVTDYFKCAEGIIDGVKVPECESGTTIDCFCKDTESINSLDASVVKDCTDANITTKDVLKYLCEGTPEGVSARKGSLPMMHAERSVRQSRQRNARAYAPPPKSAHSSSTTTEQTSTSVVEEIQPTSAASNAPGVGVPGSLSSDYHAPVQVVSQSSSTLREDVFTSTSTSYHTRVVEEPSPAATEETVTTTMTSYHKVLVYVEPTPASVQSSSSAAKQPPSAPAVHSVQVVQSAVPTPKVATISTPATPSSSAQVAHGIESTGVVQSVNTIYVTVTETETACTCAADVPTGLVGDSTPVPSATSHAPVVVQFSPSVHLGLSSSGLLNNLLQAASTPTVVYEEHAATSVPGGSGGHGSSSVFAGSQSVATSTVVVEHLVHKSSAPVESGLPSFNRAVTSTPVAAHQFATQEVVVQPSPSTVSAPASNLHGLASSTSEQGVHSAPTTGADPVRASAPAPIYSQSIATVVGTETLRAPGPSGLGNAQGLSSVHHGAPLTAVDAVRPSASAPAPVHSAKATALVGVDPVRITRPAPRGLQDAGAYSPDVVEENAPVSSAAVSASAEAAPSSVNHLLHATPSVEVDNTTPSSSAASTSGIETSSSAASSSVASPSASSHLLHGSAIILHASSSSAANGLLHPATSTHTANAHLHGSGDGVDGKDKSKGGDDDDSKDDGSTTSDDNDNGTGDDLDDSSSSASPAPDSTRLVNGAVEGAEAPSSAVAAYSTPSSSSHGKANPFTAFEGRAVHQQLPQGLVVLAIAALMAVMAVF
ncbi:hypothetical protein ASPZODRAFT_18504 [Penicilliopsis zonata CBS 506.65]|uniref:Extracellular membrane protein CFEM domain-containing protein n=1 Tax=Penicilliopsis zonata CBS 506.65 TaxID=1073090 RepID=A0A1L9SAW4_9EURO|nr:hypothetical protein ASPZODRAFT_18504 [Penicilliopsis zonata CBS 506.65]OJJ44304.1 hypothetical protein ASPZODRAFT_18504 [Penicilliopsis zonata CBS 506.65]